jgi:hypothetical protein
VWQYTAIDVASAYTWATLQVTRRNPSALWTSALARQVASDLAARGWRLERVMSDNASEFRSSVFQQTVARLGARHTFIRAGRPQTNGCNGCIEREAGVCSLPDPQADRATAGSGPLPALLQHRTRPHRQVDQRPDARGGPREGQAVAQKPLMRRHISGTGQIRSRPTAVHGVSQGATLAGQVGCPVQPIRFSHALWRVAE